MSEKFTPGEWEVNEKTMECGNLYRYGFEVVSPDVRKRVCYSETDEQKNVEEMQANAHLIKAAPEMHDLLDEVGSDLAVALNSSPGIENKIWQDILKEDVEKICALLKKARGES